LQPEPAAFVFRSYERDGFAVGIVVNDELHVGVSAEAVLNRDRVVYHRRVGSFAVAHIANPRIAEEPQGAFRRERDGIGAVAADPAVGLLEEGVHFWSGLTISKLRRGGQGEEEQQNARDLFNNFSEASPPVPRAPPHPGPLPRFAAERETKDECFNGEAPRIHEAFQI